jgi:hypothetical protein
MKTALRILFALLVAAIALYIGDTIVFQLRGNPTASITVDQLIAIPLKGNKTEYDSNGTLTVTCSRTLFPQHGWNPCWYVIQNQKKPIQY